MWKKYSPEGLVVLALSDEPPAKVEKAVLEWPLPFPVGANSSSNAKYRVGGIPQGFLIGGDGTILWQGHPMSEDWLELLPEALEAARAMAPSWDPGERDAVLERAVAASRKGKFSQAWKETERLRKRHAEEPAVLEVVEAFRKDFLEMATSRAAWYTKQTEKGHYYTATEGLERLCKDFQGTPPAAEWKTTLKVWKKDKEIQNLCKIDKDLARARAFLRADQAKQALSCLLRLRTKAAGTPLEQEVLELLSQARIAAR